jgi:hypothetical protein
LHIHAALAWPTGKAEARDRGNDERKGIVRIAAMGTGIGQERQNAGHFEEAAGPAMGDDQGQGIGALALLMDEMDGETRMVIAIVRKAIETLALFLPVIIFQPVAVEVAQVIEISAEVPAGIIASGQRVRCRRCRRSASASASAAMVKLSIDPVMKCFPWDMFLKHA